MKSFAAIAITLLAAVSSALPISEEPAKRQSAPVLATLTAFTGQGYTGESGTWDLPLNVCIRVPAPFYHNIGSVQTDAAPIKIGLYTSDTSCSQQVATLVAPGTVNLHALNGQDIGAGIASVLITYNP